MKRKNIFYLIIFIILLLYLKNVYSSSYGICVISTGKITDSSGLGKSITVSKSLEKSNIWTGHFDETNILIRVLVGGEFQPYDTDSLFKYNIENLRWSIKLYIRKNSRYSWQLVKYWIGSKKTYESNTISEKIFIEYRYKIPTNFYDFKISASLSGKLSVFVKNGEGAAYSMIWIYYKEKEDNSFIGIFTNSTPLSVTVSYKGKGSSGIYISERSTPFWVKEKKGVGINNIKRLNITYFFKKSIPSNDSLYIFSKLYIYYLYKNRWTPFAETNITNINIYIASGKVFSVYSIKTNNNIISKGRIIGKIKIKINAVYRQVKSSILYVDTYPIKTDITVNKSKMSPPIKIYTTKGFIVSVNASLSKEIYTVIDPLWNNKYYKRGNTYSIFLVIKRGKNIATSSSKLLTGKYVLSFNFRILSWGSKLYLLKNNTVIYRWESYHKPIVLNLELKNEKITFMLKTKYRYGSVIIREIKLKRIDYYIFQRWKITEKNNRVLYSEKIGIILHIPLGEKYEAIAYYTKENKEKEKTPVKYFLKGEIIDLQFKEKGIYTISSQPLYNGHKIPRLNVLAILTNGTPIYFDFRKLTLIVKEPYIFKNKNIEKNRLPIILDDKYNGSRFVSLVAWNPFKKYRLNNVFQDNRTYAVYNLTITKNNSSEKHKMLIIITSLKVKLKTIYFEKHLKIIWTAEIAFYPPDIDLDTEINKNILFTLENTKRILLKTENNGSIGSLNLSYKKALEILGKEKYLIANIRWRTLIPINTITQKISIIKYTLWLKWIKFAPLSFKASVVKLPSCEKASINLQNFYIYNNSILLRDFSVTKREEFYLVTTSIYLKPTVDVLIYAISQQTKNSILIPEVTET